MALKSFLVSVIVYLNCVFVRFEGLKKKHLREKLGAEYVMGRDESVNPNFVPRSQ